jgi:hypothetical protein
VSEFDDEEFGLYEAQCAACDSWERVNDLQLCETCNQKLERDMIRKRDWNYSALSFGLSSEARESLRRDVIREYGKALELIADDPPGDAGR